MSKTLLAALTAMLLTAGMTYARPPEGRLGEWTRETRQVGNKVTIEVYDRAPYALTGDVPVATTPAPSGEWTRETRQIGNKVTIDVYRR